MKPILDKWVKANKIKAQIFTSYHGLFPVTKNKRAVAQDYHKLNLGSTIRTTWNRKVGISPPTRFLVLPKSKRVISSLYKTGQILMDAAQNQKLVIQCYQ